VVQKKVSNPPLSGNPPSGSKVNETFYTTLTLLVNAFNVLLKIGIYALNT
jgi:hypothetical protein